MNGGGGLEVREHQYREGYVRHLENEWDEGLNVEQWLTVQERCVAQ